VSDAGVTTIPSAGDVPAGRILRLRLRLEHLDVVSDLRAAIA